MKRTMTDGQADFWLLFALFSWAVACAVPPLGILLQFVGILMLVPRCNVKALPALMFMVLDRGNLVGNYGFMALRLGVTISSQTFLVGVMFLTVFWNLLKGRYDRGATRFAWLLWFPCLLPALWMSIEARSWGLVGIWSYPAMDFFIPSLYYWALSASRTYEEGKGYLLTRLLAVMFITASLVALRVMFVFSLLDLPLMFCFAVYYLRARDWRTRRGKFWAYALFLVAGFLLVFGRAIALREVGQDVDASDEYGSTFSRMAIVMVALFFALTIRRRSNRSFLRGIPMLMVVVNIAFTVFVLSTQQGARHVETQWQESFSTFGERLKYKLWGDRATVWQMGWEEMQTPPYFIRDLRQFFAPTHKGDFGLKLLPHHQFITLLARDGYWLGAMLCVFIVWVWVRAMKGLVGQLNDAILTIVLIPPGLAVFFVIGVTGQSVVSAELWANGLVCLIVPGLVYGNSLARRRTQMGCSPPAWRGYGPPPLPPRPMPPPLGWRGR